FSLSVLWLLPAASGRITCTAISPPSLPNVAAPRELRMSVSYPCPTPACGVTLKTPPRVAAGKSVPCPKCKKPFVPEPVEKDSPNLGTLKIADEKPKNAPAPATKKPFEDD